MTPYPAAWPMTLACLILLAALRLLLIRQRLTPVALLASLAAMWLALLLVALSMATA